MYFAYMDCTRTLRTRIHPTHPACAHPACWVANSSYRWRQPCDQQHGLTTKPYCIEGGLRMFSHRNCFALLCFCSRNAAHSCRRRCPTLTQPCSLIVQTHTQLSHGPPSQRLIKLFLRLISRSAHLPQSVRPLFHATTDRRVRGCQVAGVCTRTLCT